MLRILVLKSFSKGVRSYEKRITSNWWYNIVEAFMGSPLVALLDIFKIAFFMILCIFYSSYYRYIVKKKKNPASQNFLLCPLPTTNFSSSIIPKKLYEHF